MAKFRVTHVDGELREIEGDIFEWTASGEDGPEISLHYSPATPEFLRRGAADLAELAAVLEKLETEASAAKGGVS
jgi:hypothetical protein